MFGVPSFPTVLTKPRHLVSFLLMTALRDRMYWLSRFARAREELYGPARSHNRMAKWHANATRSIASLRDTFRRASV